MSSSDNMGELQQSLVCAVCGKTLLLEEDVRYVVRIQVYAAPDPMEISKADLKQDFRRKIAEIVEQTRNMTEQELSDSVYKEMVFYLCPACQKAYLKNPLPPSPAGEA